MTSWGRGDAVTSLRRDHGPGRWHRYGVSERAAGRSARDIAAFLKNAWAKEPVIVTSFAIGITALMLPWVSPVAHYQTKMNCAVPLQYPVPVRDDDNMPDIPSHPCDKIGPSLEWLKRL
ncbi:NADH dehydrogenase [ubiquinone] 1 alpha subcomplex subunit 3 isoform X2 [Rhinoraja longicauda]